MDKVVVLIKRTDYNLMSARDHYSDIHLKLYAAIIAEKLKASYELIVYNKMLIKKSKEDWKLDVLDSETGITIIYPEKIRKVVLLGSNIPMKCYDISSIDKVFLDKYNIHDPISFLTELREYFGNGFRTYWKLFTRDILSVNPSITFSEPNMLKHIKTLHDLSDTDFESLTGTERKHFTQALVGIIKLIKPDEKLKVNELMIKNATDPIIKNRFDKTCGYNNGLISIVMSLVVLENLALNYTSAVKSKLVKAISLSELESNHQIWLGTSLGYAYNLIDNLKKYFPTLFRILETYGSIPDGVVYTIDTSKNDRECVYYVSKNKLDVINLLGSGDMIVLY